jgi:hypothetical protein
MTPEEEAELEILEMKIETVKAQTSMLKQMLGESKPEGRVGDAA